jgi:hypothetical protein
MLPERSLNLALKSGNIGGLLLSLRNDKDLSYMHDMIERAIQDNDELFKIVQAYIVGDLVKSEQFDLAIK